jgi:excisionase family DNA binding protein
MSVCDSPRDLLTRQQAAEYLGLKPQTLAVWATNKRYALPFVKVGSLVRYRRSDLVAFLQSRTVNGGPADSAR